MDGPWYQMSSPTSQDVKEILLKKGYSENQARMAIEYVSGSFGSWWGFNTFTLPKMITYLKGNSQEIRQVGNGC